MTVLTGSQNQWVEDSLSDAVVEDKTPLDAPS